VSDIVFEIAEQVTVLCDNLKVQGHDLLLDSPTRRKAGHLAGFRRALVHDQNDGLTFNFGNDYPGGVTITGVQALDVTGDLQFRISHHDAILVKGGNPPDEKVSLSDVVKTLRKQIADLQAQVTALAARP
jgi:hypothetical protein